jgi:hypothetical protein
MDKNIFIKNKKFNPDIDTNYSKKLSERNNAIFNLKDEFINNNNNTDNPKVYEQDKPISDMDLMIQQRLAERNQEESSIADKLKPTKNFIDKDDPTKFQEYNNLKNEQIKYESKNVKENETFNNIMDDLKDLGILK